MSGTGIPQPPTAAPDSAAEPQAAKETGLRALTPVDPPMLPFALGGVAIWLIALLVMLPFRDSHESWFWICVAGLLWGIPGTITMLRYDAHRKRRRQR